MTKISGHLLLCTRAFDTCFTPSKIMVADFYFFRFSFRSVLSTHFFSSFSNKDLEFLWGFLCSTSFLSQGPETLSESATESCRLFDKNSHITSFRSETVFYFMLHVKPLINFYRNSDSSCCFELRTAYRHYSDSCEFLNVKIEEKKRRKKGESIFSENGR